MNMTDELERLDKLYKDGVLNDDEFAKAKAKLLNQDAESDSPATEQNTEDNSLGTAANRYVTFQIIVGIIGFVIFLIVLFGVILPHLPSNNSPFGR